MNSYELSRNWFDWCFENPEKISPNHSALYFFAIEHCNRMGWKEKFGFPTAMAKDAIGIKSYNTYIKTLNDLVDWGFIIMIERCKNQHSSNIIALSNFNKAPNKALDKALDKAMIKHLTKHTLKQRESTSESNCSINKHITNKQLNHEQENNLEQIEICSTDSDLKISSKEESFEKFWNMYGRKIGREKCLDEFKKLSQQEINQIFVMLPKYINSTPEIKYRKYPKTWLNDKSWNDEISESENLSLAEKQKIAIDQMLNNLSRSGG